VQPRDSTTGGSELQHAPTTPGERMRWVVLDRSTCKQVIKEVACTDDCAGNIVSPGMISVQDTSSTDRAAVLEIKQYRMLILHMPNALTPVPRTCMGPGSTVAVQAGCVPRGVPILSFTSWLVVGIHRQAHRSSIVDPMNVTPRTNLVRILCVVSAKCDTRSAVVAAFRPPRPANAMDPHNQPKR
jgi:hypothetical protein